MTDIEMTRLCAEAMGYKLRNDSKDLVMLDRDTSHDNHTVSVMDINAAPIHSVFDYDPFHNDTQAMALMKKFGLCVHADNDLFWVRQYIGVRFLECIPLPSSGIKDLNRAVVECVAKMQAAK